MNKKNFRTCLLLAPLLWGGFLLACNEAVAQESCVSDKCHAERLKGKTVHPVAESCDNCHEAVATPHPSKGKKTFKLTQEPPDLCYACHEEFGKRSTIHPPVQQGMCTTCHDPHASDELKLLSQPQKDLCGNCHADHLDFKVMHGPVSAGSCTACHTPHESDDKTLLLKQGEDLCFGCHLDMPDVLKKGNVHPALSSGGCTSCHNPHGSAYPRMLTEEGQELCFLCHDEIKEKVEKSPVVHGAVKTGKGCVNCHSPHASENAKLLLNPQKETCLGCHPTILAKNMTVFHGPINDGKCTACHDPHGSEYPKLLAKKGLPPEPYVAYSETEYALCFGCHKRDLLQYPDTSFATNFRDGERNLHYLHVNKQKGRSCRMCHNIHGSDGPRLIAESVPFGRWNLPLKFVKTETGGGCSPGCHKPQSYDRESPGRKPAPPEPAGKRD